VVEYALTEQLRDPASREYVKATTAGVAEPWLSSHSPETMANLLSTHGFQTMHQHRPADLGPQFWTRSDAVAPSDLLIVAHARIDAASRVTAVRPPSHAIKRSPMPGILGPGSPWSPPVRLVTLLRGVGESKLDRRTVTQAWP
jgi:hypothetical protein